MKKILFILLLIVGSVSVLAAPPIESLDVNCNMDEVDVGGRVRCMLDLSRPAPDLAAFQFTVEMGTPFEIFRFDSYEPQNGAPVYLCEVQNAVVVCVAGDPANIPPTVNSLGTVTLQFSEVSAASPVSLTNVELVDNNLQRFIIQNNNPSEPISVVELVNPCRAIGQIDCGGPGTTVGGQELVCHELGDVPTCVKPSCVQAVTVLERVQGARCLVDAECADGSVCLNGAQNLGGEGSCAPQAVYDTFKDACVGSIMVCMIEDCGVGEGSCNLGVIGPEAVGMDPNLLCAGDSDCAAHANDEYANVVKFCQGPVSPVEDPADDPADDPGLCLAASPQELEFLEAILAELQRAENDSLFKKLVGIADVIRSRSDLINE